MTDQDLVSIVIPTVGRASVVGVLAGLGRQQGAGRFEIIVVVDGGPPFDLAGIQVPGCESVRSLTVPVRSGVSVARNLGASDAGGEILGFLDDDTVPDPHWVATVRNVVGEGHVVAAVGRISEIGVGPLGRLRRLAYNQRHIDNCLPSTDLPGSSGQAVEPCRCRRVDYLSGGNCCVRASSFHQVGGFDPAYLVGQDRELANRLIDLDPHISYEPAMVVEHRTVSTVRGLIKGRFASGAAAAAMARYPPPLVPRMVAATYGMTLPRIVRTTGISSAALAAASVAAYQLGYHSVSLRPSRARLKKRSFAARIEGQ